MDARRRRDETRSRRSGAYSPGGIGASDGTWSYPCACDALVAPQEDGSAQPTFGNAADSASIVLRRDIKMTIGRNESAVASHGRA